MSRFSIPGIPVLLYHGIAPGRSALADRYWLLESELRAQLRLLRGEGYQTVHVRDSGALQPEPRRIAITFDDGLASDYRLAFPLLLKHGFAADFFVNTAYIDSPGYLRWSEMLEMQRAGMSFQSHGHRHANYLALKPEAVVEELRLSRELLQQKLGRAADCFSAPYGQLNRCLIDAAHQAGFALICSSRNWPARRAQRVIGRIYLCHGLPPEEFLALAQCSALPLIRRSLREALLFLPKRLLHRLRPQWRAVGPFPEKA
jgi:peptidoglycan/xylan/chitin deacetylase (PgdA/CDA1 family)